MARRPQVIKVGTLSVEDVLNFHPHIQDFGGVEQTKKILSYITNGSMKITGWTDGGRNAIVFTCMKNLIVVIWGNDNPTMFPTDVNYARRLTSGMFQVNSSAGLDELRDQINTMAACL